MRSGRHRTHGAPPSAAASPRDRRLRQLILELEHLSGKKVALHHAA
jgi:hypothetical protein